jgi:hypothetical protein
MNRATTVEERPTAEERPTVDERPIVDERLIVDEYYVPIDPMDDLQCDSCQ